MNYQKLSKEELLTKIQKLEDEIQLSNIRNEEKYRNLFDTLADSDERFNFISEN